MARAGCRSHRSQRVRTAGSADGLLFVGRCIGRFASSLWEHGKGKALSRGSFQVRADSRCERAIETSATGRQSQLTADSKGFHVLPKRWIVERSHAWYERCRRLIMHHHRLLSVSEAWVWLAGARMLAGRFATAIRVRVYPRCVMSIPPHCRSRYSATSRRWQ